MSKLSDRYERASKSIEDAANMRERELQTRRIAVYKDIVQRIKVHVKANPPEAGRVFDFATYKLVGWHMSRPQSDPHAGRLRFVIPLPHSVGLLPEIYFLEDGRIFLVPYSSPYLLEFKGFNNDPSERFVFGLLHGFACDHDIHLGHGTEYADWSALYDNPPLIERRHWRQPH